MHFKLHCHDTNPFKSSDFAHISRTNSINTVPFNKYSIEILNRNENYNFDLRLYGKKNHLF